MKHLFDVLFDANEHVCVTPTVFGTTTYHIKTARQYGHPFFCINPLAYVRKDSDVTKFRNILLEFDSGTQSEQLEAIKASGLPYTSLVFSGNKSVHCIISLQEPILDERNYRELVTRIMARFPGCDRSTKNPSRLSRTPDIKRPDTGAMQVQIELKDRVANADLLNWLGPAEPKVRHEINESDIDTTLSPWASSFIRWGAPEGQRNATLFKVACELLRKGRDVDTIEELALAVLDLTPEEIRRTIKSAEVAVRRGS